LAIAEHNVPSAAAPNAQLLARTERAQAEGMPWLQDDNPDDFVCIDSETCGFFGPIVLFQYGVSMHGKVHLHSVFKEPIWTTLALFEWLMQQRVLGFNLSFDHFKIQQAYTCLLLLGEMVGYDELPEDHLDAYAAVEMEARDGPCLKPRSAQDLMLFARKGPWQNLMARDPITVRRVPTVIAKLVRDELEKRVQIPDIFFAKRSKARKHEPKWKIKPCRNTEDFVNIELVFAPSSALKALATHELKLDPKETLVFADVEIDRKFLPVENGFAPFAYSVGKPGNWKGAWPEVIKQHIGHWSYNPLARDYATRDILYPRLLWDKWGRPDFGDDDSVLACLAGSARWKGYSIDPEGISKLRDAALKRMDQAPRAPGPVMAYMKEVLSEIEQIVLQDKKTGALTTKRVVLEEIKKQRTDDPCTKHVEKCGACGGTNKKCKDCSGNFKCPRCTGTGTEPTEASHRASRVLDARKAKKEVELYDKLLLAGRFHVSVNVIGTRSSRQSGGQVSEGKKAKKSGSVNPQGIQKKKVVRAQFPLAFFNHVQEAQGLKPSLENWSRLCDWTVEDLDEVLVGGDFDAFEVNIADAYYEDPQLHEDLIAQELSPDGKPLFEDDGKPKLQKIHAVIGTLVYPHDCGNPELCEKQNQKCPKPRSYWSIKNTDGKDPDLYTRSKSGFFALIYFGNEKTLEERLGIPNGTGMIAYKAIMARYKVMGKKREEFFDRFCPIRQPGGIGSRVVWVDPEDYVESMLGFKRFFTLENQIIRALYELAEDVPPEWRDIKIKVMRRERLQTVAGACQSALFAAAFAVQGANMRAAGNHVIQSTGAGLTKILQRRIWDLQPYGISPWLVRPMNVHDELPTAVVRRLVARVAQVQREFIAEYKKLIPLLGMKWKEMQTWAGK
jgi:hypothetical protein